MRHSLRYIVLPILVGFIIFVGTCILTADNVPRMPEGVQWDKIAHFGMFFVLSAVCFFDYYQLRNGKPKWFPWIVFGFVIPVLYGGVIELMQKYFFASRSAEWGDFIADALGSLLAMIVAFLLYRKKQGKNRT